MNQATGSERPYNPLAVVGWVGLVASAALFGIAGTVIMAVLYGMVYAVRKEGSSGLMVLASFLFWALVIMSPGALVVGGISLFMLEIAYIISEEGVRA